MMTNAGQSLKDLKDYQEILVSHLPTSLGCPERQTTAALAPGVALPTGLSWEAANSSSCAKFGQVFLANKKGKAYY